MKRVIVGFLATASLMLLFTEESYGIPAFSRKYRTSCSTCHYAAPMLNAFGKAFKNNGYRYPAGTDPEMTKEEPVSLGSEAYKKVWPNAIWPSDIPGTSPVSVWAVGRINYAAMSTVKWEFEIPHEVEILYAGTMGEEFSFFGEVEIENEANATEIAFPFALQYDMSPGLHVRMGMVHADPTPNHLKLTRNHYNMASFRSRNGWRFRDEHVGLEVWGAGNGSGERGGFTYRLGVVNGQGLSDMNRDKDYYAKATYKIGGLGEVGGTEGAGSDVSDFFLDDNVTLGAFVYSGTASKTGVLDENFSIVGGDVDFWYKRFILNGAIMLMDSRITGTPQRKSMVYYAQANAVLYPWLIGLIRYEWEDQNTDLDAVKPVNAVIPGITLMARANVKLMFEFKKFFDEDSKKKDTFGIQVNFGF
ncbi:MAG: hypothetical protein A2X67_01895 [Ignavibacteria bacterium GWA2_55_11]|nr:MAG: hypothetical protein A2X67_01895 [Ignavibacteria bacterium GWA2_55_11]OGU45209.1 MAG: hypothetical protein A2X68_01780 [Ignavibacteria bacterium GWC2_56_12]